MKKTKQIRQGDVFVFRVASLPADAVALDHNANRLVLAYGEVTGHAHAIYDFADEANAAILKARLLLSPTKRRFLEIKKNVNLDHEEHTKHVISSGIYRLPQQMEYTPAALRNVAD